MRLNRPKSRSRTSRRLALALTLFGWSVAAVTGCSSKPESGTLVPPPIKDDYGKQMDDFMKTHPPREK